MYIIGLGTAHPEHRYTKADCWNGFKASPWFDRLDRRARIVTEMVLSRDNGIEARRLAVDTLDEVFSIDPDTLHARFLANAPVLATQAGQRALDDAGLQAADIDAVIVSTCTGYLCPALSSYVTESLGLRADVQALDLVGQGCGAALPNMRIGEALIASGRTARVLSICVEISSAAMYLDNDLGVLISACLFGDGAGAAVLSATPQPGKRRVRWMRAASITAPAHRDALRFEQRGGLLRNILTREVPGLAATYAERVLDDVLAAEGLATRCHRRLDLACRRPRRAGRAMPETGPDRSRCPAQRRDTARIRQPQQRIRLLRAAGGIGGRGPWWTLVAGLVRCRFQQPWRAAGRGLSAAS